MTPLGLVAWTLAIGLVVLALVMAAVGVVMASAAIADIVRTDIRGRR